ncbi:hypothetical protein [Butyrivibrio sp. FCS014]|uniref:hypothetical protein n=1 Tax=Butyrivibrio sp. FCS014 TaxID=1408304 RepID=UPI0004675F60|nr:hypothetical protein [Butyrivibrio sp. FCS014]
MKHYRINRVLLTFVSVAVILCIFKVDAYATPKEMPDGTMFDAEYYASAYPDVVAALGNSEAALWQHYMQYGKAEGRNPVAPAGANNTAQKAVIAGTSAGKVTSKTLAAANKTHKYYTKIPADVVKASDTYAQQIADSIMADPTYTTDLQRVNAAAQSVALMCSVCQYGSDSTKYYRSPAGVYIAGIYTCAGSTRALGRILDYMGYTWTHANENQNRHQWCILTMDGQTGFADGMGGFAGYGNMTNGMTLPDGRVIYYAE